MRSCDPAANLVAHPFLLTAKSRFHSLAPPVQLTWLHLSSTSLQAQTSMSAS